MFNTSLVLLSTVPHPGNQYEPAHVRHTFFDRDSKEYVARATIGQQIIVEVTGSNNIAAEMTLSTRLVEIFRAIKKAA